MDTKLGETRIISCLVYLQWLLPEGYLLVNRNIITHQQQSGSPTCQPLLYNRQRSDLPACTQTDQSINSPGGEKKENHHCKVAPSYSCKIGITQYRAYSFCMFLQIPIFPTPVILRSQRSPGCHFSLMSYNPLPIRQTLPGSQCLTAFGFPWSHSTAKLKPLVNRACKLSEYFDLLKISVWWSIFFRRRLLLIHWTAGLGWQTRQCDPRVLFPYNKEELTSASISSYRNCFLNLVKA